MKMYLTIIKTLLSQLKLKHILIILLGVSIVLAFIFYNKSRRFKKEAQVSKNNLEAYQEQTTTSITALGKAIAERNVIVYTTKQLAKSQAKEIEELRSVAKENDIKLKHTQSLYRTALEINEELKSKVHTVVKYVYVNDTIDSVYIQRDTARISSLQIIRAYQLGADSAEYDVTYTPILYTYVDKYKEGNWKLKNLFKWRDWQYKVTVISNDSILKPKDVIYIKNIDNE